MQGTNPYGIINDIYIILSYYVSRKMKGWPIKQTLRSINGFPVLILITYIPKR
jgi:hypothetical protein